LDRGPGKQFRLQRIRYFAGSADGLGGSGFNAFGNAARALAALLNHGITVVERISPPGSTGGGDLGAAYGHADDESSRTEPKTFVTFTFVV